MMNYLVGQIHIQLDENESWSGANCLSPDHEILLDAPDVLVTVVCGFLKHSLSICTHFLDEPFLRLGTGCLDCELPKPLIESHVSL